MKTIRELRIRFEPMGSTRPRVFWRRSAAPSAPGDGDQSQPSLQIEVRGGSMFITSTDDRGARAEGASPRQEWEELSDTRSAWTSGVRLAVEFAEEFPDGAGTVVGIPIIEAGADLMSQRRRAGAYPALDEPPAQTRILDTTSLYAALRGPDGKPLPDAGSSTRFFAIEERIAAISNPTGAAAGATAPSSKKRSALGPLLRGRMNRPRALLLAVLTLCFLALFAARWRLSARAQKVAPPTDRPAAAAAPLTPGQTGTRHVKDAPPPEITNARPVNPEPSRGERTLERRAADAIETGAFSEAAGLYDELTRQHPDAPVYREASRIVHQQKAATGRSARAAR
jgi:hypothetical protein